MKKHTIRLWLILGMIGILATAIVVQAAPPRPPSVDLDVIGGGATMADNGSYALLGTIGQVATGSSNGSYQIGHGFWQVSFKPIFRINLPSVLSN